MAQEEGDGDGHKEHVVCRHDVNLVDAESQTDVQGNVEEEEKHRQTEELGAHAEENAQSEEQQNDALYDVVDGRVVAHDDRTASQHVLQQVLAMQLDGFAKEVFQSRLCARGRDVGPAHKLAFGNGLARVSVPYLLMVSHVLRLCLFLYDGFHGSLYLCRVFHLCRIAILLVNQLLGLFALLYSHLVACHLLGPYKGAVFHTCHSPHQGGWQDDAQEQILGTEEFPTVGKQGCEECL